MTVTDSDILEILGPVEPAIVAAIRAMGATRDELEDATSEGEPFENLADERVDELRAILARRGIALAPADGDPAHDEEWRPQDIVTSG